LTAPSFMFGKPNRIQRPRKRSYATSAKKQTEIKMLNYRATTTWMLINYYRQLITNP